MNLMTRLRRRRSFPIRQPEPQVFFELRIVDCKGKVRVYSTWEDVPDPAGRPRNSARLHAEATLLCEEPGDRGSLYTYPNLQARSLIEYVGPVMPTGGDLRLALKKALRGLRDNGAWWVTESVLDRLCDYLYTSDLSMSYLDARITDALDDDDTYRGEGKDWHIAPMLRAIHAGLAEIGKSLAVESTDDVLTVERTWPSRDWPQFGVPSCDDCENGIQHMHWSGDPDPSLRDTVAGDDDGLDEEIGIRPCTCWGEGCDACDNTGVIYP